MNRKSSMQTQSNRTSEMTGAVHASRKVTNVTASHRELVLGETTIKALNTICDLLRTQHNRIKNLESHGNKSNALRIRRAA